jgi:hypothetical protein
MLINQALMHFRFELATYTNPSDRTKVLTALQQIIAEYYETIRADRWATYGDRITVVTQPPQEAAVGKLPGLTYGFSSVDKANVIQERYVSYMAFDGSKYLYIIVTSYDPAAETNKFDDLVSLERFLPNLKAIVADLNLPHPDW